MVQSHALVADWKEILFPASLGFAQTKRTVGWAFNIASSLIVAKVFGFMTRERTGAPARAFRTLYSGLAVLIVAIGLLAIGSSITVS